MQSHQIRTLTLAALTCLTCCALGCAKEKYTAKPLKPEATIAKIQQKSATSEDFKNYLRKQNYPENNIPFSAWGIDELTLSALYHHPELNLAKAKLGLAEAQLATAGADAPLGINGTLARSNQANGDIRPWSYGLQVEVPIVTTNKRAIRQEEAQYLVDIARMDVAESAWKLRQQLKLDLVDFHENQANIQLLSKQQAAYDHLVQIYEKRLSKGMASSVELSQAQLLSQKNQMALAETKAQSDTFTVKLAKDAGLTVETFKLTPIAPFNLESTLADNDNMLELETVPKENNTAKLQENVLLNRIDIRRGLAQYAVAESKIKLEVAKQTPDITLTPSIAFDFGDRIWSLGFSSLLNLLNRHPTQIKEAEQMRAIEGANFEMLQSNVISELSQTQAQYQAAKQNVTQASLEYTAQIQHLQKLQKQFDLGLIDRLALTQGGLSPITSQQQLQNWQFNLLRVQFAFENLMQRPLYNKPSFNISPSH